MRQLWMCALCLIAVTALALPLHAQSPAPSPPMTPSPAPATDADFLAELQTPQAPPADLPWLWTTSCTLLQCRAICECGGGCVSVCVNASLCQCTCKSTHVPPLPCQV